MYVSPSKFIKHQNYKILKQITLKVTSCMKQGDGLTVQVSLGSPMLLVHLPCLRSALL